MKKGDKVIIKSTYHTKRYVGLDSHGEMKRMVGKRFTLYKATTSRGYIRGPESDFLYTWMIADLMLANDEYKESEPQIFHYDIKNL